MPAQYPGIGCPPSSDVGLLRRITNNTAIMAEATGGIAPGGLATSANQTSLNALVATAAKQDTLAGIVALASKQPALGTAGTPSADVISTQGFGYTSVCTMERPNNATPYTALDVLGVKDAGTPANPGSAIMTFANIGPVGGGWVWIDWASLEIDVAAVPAGMNEFRQHLYSASPAAILDNAAFDLVAADRALHKGYILLPAPIDLGSTIKSDTEAQNYSFRKLVYVPAGGTLYGELQTLNGYTPTALAVKSVTLHSVSA